MRVSHFFPPPREDLTFARAVSELLLVSFCKTCRSNYRYSHCFPQSIEYEPRSCTDSIVSYSCHVYGEVYILGYSILPLSFWGTLGVLFLHFFCFTFLLDAGDLSLRFIGRPYGVGVFSCVRLSGRTDLWEVCEIMGQPLAGFALHIFLFWNQVIVAHYEFNFLPLLPVPCIRNIFRKKYFIPCGYQIEQLDPISPEYHID